MVKSIPVPLEPPFRGEMDTGGAVARPQSSLVATVDARAYVDAACWALQDGDAAHRAEV